MKNKIIYIGAFAGIIVLSAGYYFGIYIPKGEEGIASQQVQDLAIQEQQHEEIEDGSNIVLYGVLKTFSSSGEMKFYYYSMEENKVVDSDGKPWFWVAPNPFDQTRIDKFVKYIQDTPDTVFKITGKKEKDDCGYTDDGRCYGHISFDTIEVAPDPNAPKFEDYPAGEKFNGTPVAPDFNTKPEAKRYYTKITEGAKGEPNFAGEYTLILYGCGFGCQYNTIVNARTGNIVAYNIMSNRGTRHKLDSRLLVVNPPEELYESYGSDIPSYVSTEYYILSEDGVELVKL